MRLVQALQLANKDFELMIYPSSRHGIGGPHYTGSSSTSSAGRSAVRATARARVRKNPGQGLDRE